MDSRLSLSEVKEILKLNTDGTLFHRESKELEFKEQFNWAGIAEYLRDFAAFANNSGGYLVFGVSNSPRKLTGLSEKALDAFDKIDPEKITGHILEHFSQNINHDCKTFKINNLYFGVFYIEASKNKPVICKKDAGTTLKNADIYYRYGGRTQKIQHSELENIIQYRIEKQNIEWRNFLMDSAKIEPSTAHILTSQTSNIGKNNNIIYIDSQTAEKINFLKKGEFKEKKGEKAIMLIGEAKMLGASTIEKKVTENLLEKYPYTFKQLRTLIYQQCQNVKQNQIHRIIKENKIKDQEEYSTYLFGSREQQQAFKEGKIGNRGLKSLYNNEALDYIITVLKNECQKNKAE